MVKGFKPTKHVYQNIQDLNCKEWPKANPFTDMPSVEPAVQSLSSSGLLS